MDNDFTESSAPAMTHPAFAPAAPSKRKPEAAQPRAPGRPVVRQVPAVTRAIAILRLLGKSSEPLGVNAIARELHLIPSTCLHILRILVAEELVAFDPQSKHYSLDAGILAIARSVLRRHSFTSVVQQGLNQLSQRYSVAAVGVKVTGLDHFVVVAIAKAEQPLRIHVEIGSRFPALISATGRCLVAFGQYPWPDIERRFRELKWDRPPSFKAWRAEIDATRQRGYGIDEGNYIEGVTVMAAPVFGRSGVSHAVIVVGVSEQIRRLGIAALGKDLKMLAGQVSEQLGSA